MIINHIPSFISGHIIKSLNKVIKLYGIVGFVVCIVLVYMEFEKVADMLGNVEVKILSVQDHMGKVYRTIITLKERGRVIINALP